jgi:hypothetical protein
MKKTIVGAALLIAAAAFANTPALGQRIAVDLAWHSSTRARVSGSYGSAEAYLRSGYRYCAPEGRYLYCWDRQAYRPGRPMAVHVFQRRGPADREYNRYGRTRGRDHRIMDQRTYRRHERAAQKAWQRWYSHHRRMVGPAYNGHRAQRHVRAPRISLRLRFHL